MKNDHKIQKIHSLQLNQNALSLLEKAEAAFRVDNSDRDAVHNALIALRRIALVQFNLPESTHLMAPINHLLSALISLDNGIIDPLLVRTTPQQSETQSVNAIKAFAVRAVEMLRAQGLSKTEACERVANIIIRHKIQTQKTHSRSSETHKIRPIGARTIRGWCEQISESAHGSELKRLYNTHPALPLDQDAPAQTKIQLIEGQLDQFIEGLRRSGLLVTK